MYIFLIILFFENASEDKLVIPTQIAQSAHL